MSTMARAHQVHLVAYPEGEIGPEHFVTVEVDLPPLADGEVLVRTLFTSVDPALRLRLRPVGPEGYFGNFPLHQAMDEILTVGWVVESRAPGFGVGDVVTHGWGWRDLAIVPAGVVSIGGVGTLTRVDTALGAPEQFLGALGNMGLTAWVGLVHTAELREGDVVWVSAAAGAVGSLVAQIAKLRGHTVIGSAGSPEKVAYLRDELGLDAAFDYHDGPVAELLRAAAPEGIDVYFDAVGGDHLEAALGALRPWGRVALCGQISDYERTEPQPGPRNMFQIVSNDLTLRGFRASHHLHLADTARAELAGYVADGRLRYRETIVEGLDRAPEALALLLAGGTVGKTLVRV
jgi:NADPH-dependent curcumin reductase CurA